MPNSSPKRPGGFRDKYLSNQPVPSPLDLELYYGLSMGSRGMSLITVQYVLRGWLWGVSIKATIDYISPAELACQFITLDSRVDKVMDCIACICETTTGLVSPPPRY